MTTDPRPADAGEPAATEPAPAPAGRSNRRRNIILLLVAVIALDVAAAIVVPPFPKGAPGQPISGIGDLRVQAGENRVMYRRGLGRLRPPGHVLAFAGPH